MITTQENDCADSSQRSGISCVIQRANSSELEKIVVRECNQKSHQPWEAGSDQSDLRPAIQQANQGNISDARNKKGVDPALTCFYKSSRIKQYLRAGVTGATNRDCNL